MIKVSVLYPNKPGARFDHEYYKSRHMPLVKERMGDACLYYTVEKGLAGGEPGSPPTYIASCQIVCESPDAFVAAWLPGSLAGCTAVNVASVPSKETLSAR